LSEAAFPALVWVIFSARAAKTRWWQRFWTRRRKTNCAAGLVHGADGGGIVYALVSARLLAEALLTGEDYEKLMQPYVSKVAFLAENKAKHQFLANMMIIKKGQKALNKG
jgi:flavin-dependent dehydrogenase